MLMIESWFKACRVLEIHHTHSSQLLMSQVAPSVTHLLSHDFLVKELKNNLLPQFPPFQFWIPQPWHDSHMTSPRHSLLPKHDPKIKECSKLARDELKGPISAEGVSLTWILCTNQIKASTCPSHKATHRAFDCPPKLRMGSLNLAWVWWEIWTWTVKSFLAEHMCFFSFNVEVFKVIKLTFVSWWLKRKGLLESHGPWSCLL